MDHFIQNLIKLSLISALCLSSAFAVNLKCSEMYRPTICSIQIQSELLEPITVNNQNEIVFAASESRTPSDVEEFQLYKYQNFATTILPSATIFETFPNLRKLIYRANVTAISSTDFEGAGKLTHMDLAENHLQEIPTRAFYSAYNLQELSLEQNRIQTIADYAFDGLEYLRTLNLGQNRLTKISRFTLVNLPLLRYLDVSNNAITVIEPEALNLPNLEFFYVQKNQLTFFAETQFALTPQLHNLYAQNNPIQRLNNALERVPKLEVVVVNSNLLEYNDQIILSKYNKG